MIDVWELFQSWGKNWCLWDSCEEITGLSIDLSRIDPIGRQTDEIQDAPHGLIHEVPTKMIQLFHRLDGAKLEAKSPTE